MISTMPRPMTRTDRITGAVLAVVAVLAVSGCSRDSAAGGDGTRQTTSTTAAGEGGRVGRIPGVRRDGATYRVPDAVPDAADAVPGALVAASDEGPSKLMGQANRSVVLYRSSDAAGRPTTVSGTVLVPPGPPPAGGWPVISWGHGTVGVAARCAPSATDNLFYNEYAQEARSFVAAGYAVVATDYPGLGTPGPHPYLDGVGEGNAVVDIVTAAHQLVVDLAPDWFAVGHSQGGQAVLFASRVAAERAPALPLRATIAIAPASHLELLLPTVIAGGSPADYVYALYALAGIAAVDPSVDLGSLLGPEGRSRLPLIIDDGCLLDTYDEFKAVPADGTFAVSDERLTALSDDLARIGNPDTAPTVGPVLVVQGATDADVPAPLSAEMAQRLQATGSDVTYREYPDRNHDQVLGPSMCDQLAFLAEHGGPPVTDCTPEPTDLS